MHKKGEECIGKIEDFPGAITIKASAEDSSRQAEHIESQRITIRRIKATAVERILGVRLGLDGSDVTELTHRI